MTETEFEKVYQTYFRDVYLYMKKLSKDESLAEEITSETFFKAMKALDNFQKGCDIRVWLCQIAKNCYFSYLRKQKHITELDDSAVTENDLVNLEEEFCNQDTAMQVHYFLHSLPEPYKEVFSLRVLGELSFSQIGNIFGRTENWACVTYHRAKKKIQEKMEAQS